MVRFHLGLRTLLRSLSANEASLRRSEVPGCTASAKAEKRANELLISNLSAHQREQFEELGHFDVVGGDTGKRYRIYRAHQLNVAELDSGCQRVRLLCFMPRGGVPLGDVVLAQKLSLELFESDVLKVANRSPAWEDVFSGHLQPGRRYHRW
jgi:hypothetical protein